MDDAKVSAYSAIMQIFYDMIVYSHDGVLLCPLPGGVQAIKPVDLGEVEEYLNTSFIEVGMAYQLKRLRIECDCYLGDIISLN